MKFELGFTINCDSTIPIGTKWCRKLKLVRNENVQREKG